MRAWPSLPFSFCVLLSLLTHQPIAAQTGTITGVVRSAESAAPLISAVVQVTGPDGERVGSSLTNQSGRYLISAVPAGSYTIVVNTTGYATGRSEAVMVGSGQTATANFDLSRRAIDLDPITVTASRREERALDAPARVEIVTLQAIEDRPAVTRMSHLEGVPGVDIIHQGIQTTNVVARGFNNIFSGALLALTDHRIAAIPSLRVNALHLIPTTNEDVERMEVVLGPGSALYGPNSANGVLHILTRSPLSEQGTSVSITGGERSILQGSGRTAHAFGDDFAIKFSGEYLRGDDWEYVDAVEVAAREQALLTDPNTIIGLRNNSIEKWVADVRADWRFRPDATAIFSTGRTTSVDAIEMTGIGSSQVVDWAYTYYQARFNWNRVFGQVYLNTSDAGGTYRIRDGAPTVDESRMFVGQMQHGVSPRPWQNFTYGFDYLRTMPETFGTIHGRFEDEDVYTEAGVFLQSETNIARQFDLVLAGRFDRHSVIDEFKFSPRAALVFKPSQSQTLRASFNQAYSNPGSVHLFLDLGAGPAGPLGQYGWNAHIMGTGRSGFTFQHDDGAYYMRSPYSFATPGSLATPAEAQQYRSITQAELWQSHIRGLARNMGLQGAAAQSFVGFMLIQPEQPTNLPIVGLNPVTGVYSLFTPPDDVPGLRETNVTAYELGYQGIFDGRFRVAADLWYAQRDNFISAPVGQSRFLLLEPQGLQAYLVPRLTQFFILAGQTPQQAAATAAQTSALAAIPAGVVAGPNLTPGAELLVSYRNVGDIAYWGTDISAQALLGQFNVTGSISTMSDDYFEIGTEIVSLHAPKFKGAVGVGYRNEDLGVNGDVLVQYRGEYPVTNGLYVGLHCIDRVRFSEDSPCVPSHTVADVTLGYDLPQLAGASLQLVIQNALDSAYRTFVGAPEIGRMALLRLRYDF